MLKQRVRTFRILQSLIKKTQRCNRLLERGLNNKNQSLMCRIIFKIMLRTTINATMCEPAMLLKVRTAVKILS
jgi:hypothetical protein